MSIKRKLNSVVLDELQRKSCLRAQGLMEYALIIVLVAVIVLVVLAILGPGIGNLFSNVVNNI